jgi:cytochrome c5
MKYALAIVAAIILVNCKTKKETTKEATKEATKPVVVKFNPTERELAVAQKNWPNVTLAELREGNTIYREKCSKCHENFEITKFSEKKWKHEIDDMSPKAELTAAEKDKLTKFILSYREANTVSTN